MIIKIIIVGGGAGGFELVAKLCKKFKRSTMVEITLLDKELKHIWKPLYHEVAAGTFTRQNEEIDYLTYSYQNGFRFIPGTLNEIHHEEKWIGFTSRYEEYNGLPLLRQRLYYDILVLSIGSQTNDFNIPGVYENCLFLDSLAEAELFNKTLLKYVILANTGICDCIEINIVGGGATGTELAAELNYVLDTLQKYSEKTRFSTLCYRITLIEAGNRLLSMLPLPISTSVSAYLKANNIHILNNTKVASVKKNGLVTSDNKFIKSNMTIWVAGVKGNNATRHNLEVNKFQQFAVKPTLQTTKDNSIFALGDCASCPQNNKEGKTYFVPPRAQAAHQQANLLLTNLSRYIEKKPLYFYHYQDYGSLISLSRSKVVGYLMNKVTKNLYIEGFLARTAYWLLYRKHLFILKGTKYIILNTIAELLTRKQRPKIKLH